MQLGEKAAVDGLVAYPDTILFGVPNTSNALLAVQTQSLEEKPRISPGFLSGSARASDENLALDWRPSVFRKSNNVNALNVWARLFCSPKILHHLNDIYSQKNPKNKLLL